MTVEEFSIGFDTLVDSYRRFKDFDSKENLDSIEYSEYEKSLYLTMALDSLVEELYSGKYVSDSFEKTEELRRRLDALVMQASYIQGDNTSHKYDAKLTLILSSNKLIDKYIHNVFELPEDCWFIIYELAVWSSKDTGCYAGKIADIIPVPHDEYFRTIHNPFRGPNNRRVLRLDSGDSKVELVSSRELGLYIIRYISRPAPIVLSELRSDGLDIRGVDTPLTCLLSELTHQLILTRAVLAALSNRINNTNKETSK